MQSYCPSPLPTPAHLESDLASTLSPLVVVSPHYDDAVFSCGRLLSQLPGSTVLTVYTGLPDNRDVLTDWDSRCGFSSAADAMQERANENCSALDALGATGVDLNLLDSQYVPQKPRNGVDLLGDTLGATFTTLQPATVFFPLGLFHEDHLQVSDCLMTLCHGFPAIRWFAYEDIPYRKRESLVQERLEQLAQRGICALPFSVDTPEGNKATAVSAYRSQFRGLGYQDATPLLQQTERYWQIHRNMDFL